MTRKVDIDEVERVAGELWVRGVRVDGADAEVFGEFVMDTQELLTEVVTLIREVRADRASKAAP